MKKTSIKLSLLLTGLTAAGVITGATHLSNLQTAPPLKGQHPLPSDYASFYPDRKTPVAAERPLMARRAGALANGNDIYGYLYYYQGNDRQQGFYRLGEKSVPEFLWSDYYTSNWSMPMTGGWLRDGNLCGVSQLRYMGGIMVYAQVEMDMSSGEVLDYHQLKVTENMDNIYMTMAYRDLDDKVYGYGYINDGDSYGFKSAEATDIDTSKPVVKADFENICIALCYNRQDDLFYGVTTQGYFVSVAPDGTQNSLMKLSIPDLSSTITGLVYSQADGGYLYNAYHSDGSSSLVLIDPATKSSTTLYDFPAGEEFIYMVSPVHQAFDDAPQTPTDASVSFHNGDLSGTFSCTMPSATYNGQELSGKLSWNLLIDGGIIASGEAEAGSKIDIPVENVSNGQHVFALEAVDGDLRSEPAIVRDWIGSDTPLAPTDVVLTENKVSWKAPTESLHGGYVDYSDLKYTVYMNGKRLDVTTDLECAIELPQNKPYTTYSVQVKASYDGHDSERAQSNVVAYGLPLTIPEGKSLHYRPEENQFPLFKAIDLDGKTDDYGNTRNWHFSETMGFPSFASGADGEDLLIFPPISFENTEKTYAFEMEAGLISDIDSSGTIEVLIGTEPNMESMTRTVLPATHLYYMRGIILTGFFSVPEAGTYYLGVLTHTGGTGMHISDMDIRLTDRDADVPMTVDNLVATAAPDGSLYADVSFTMPTLNVYGEDLPADALLTATVTSRDYVLDHPYEGETIATTVVTGKPGEEIHTTVTTQQNYNTIGVSVSLDNRTGVETTTRLFTGLVKPYTVQNLKATVTEDNMGVHLSWTPPTEGETEGSIGDTFYYSLWYYGDGWQFLDGIGYDVCETQVSLEPDNEQTILTIGVMAMNAAGQSDYVSSASVVVGKPYTLPMDERLDAGDGYETYYPIAIQRPDESYTGSSWMLTDPAEVSPIFANESGWAYVGYIGTPDATDLNSRLSLPKFSTEGCEEVTFSLTYWGGPYEAPFSLLSNVYLSEQPTPVGSFPAGKGWITNSLTLPSDLCGRQWVELLLDTHLATDQNFAMFSGYTVEAGSGVIQVEGSGKAAVWASQGMLHVSGHAGDALIVSDMSGRTVVQREKLPALAGFALAPGSYVVKAGNESRIVLVR